MRLAVVAASSYFQSAQLTILPSADLNLELVSQRLRAREAGYLVHVFPATRGLADEVEELLSSSGPVEELLFYFSGYAMVPEGRGPQLLLDGQRMASFSLNRMRKLLRQYAPSSLVILDTVAPIESGHRPEEVVNAIGEALSAEEAPISVLAAARLVNGVDLDGPSPFTTLLENIIGGATQHRELSARGLFAEMQAAPLFEEVAAAQFFPGPHDAFLIPRSVSDDAELETEDLTLPRGHARGPLNSEATLKAPMTALGFMLAGDEHFQRGDFTAALAEYDHGLGLLSEEVTLEHIPLYVRIGRALREVSRSEDALEYFEAALAVSTSEPDALEGAVTMLLATNNVSRADAWLQHWLGFAPDNLRALDLLAEVCWKSNKPDGFVEARCQLARKTDDPRRRATLLAEAANVMIDSLGNTERGIALLREAKSADPTVPGLIERLGELLTYSSNWGELAETYEAAITHAPAARVSIELAPKLARLYREQLGDAPRAAAVLTRAAEVDTDNAELRRSLVDLHQSGGDLRQAIEHCRKLVQAAPEHAEGYRQAYRLFDRAGELDGAWNAACVLDLLGEADINESLLASAHRPEGLLPARSNLTDSDWAARLLYPERDTALDDVLLAIGDAAIEVGLVLAKKKNRLFDLEAGMLQDPQTSTATVAKTLLWASRLLGMKAPELYVMPDVPRKLAAAPARDATAVVARTLASGLSLPELAFLWGRQLSLYRPEHYALVFFPTVEELVPLLLSALGIGGSPSVDPRLLDQDAKKLASALKKQLRGPSLDRLREAAAVYKMQGPNHAMRAWVRSVELSSVRAGLLACGNLEIAARLSKRFPFGSEVSPDRQVADLMAYSLSREYAELRARLGVKLVASSFPP